MFKGNHTGDQSIRWKNFATVPACHIVHCVELPQVSSVIDSETCQVIQMTSITSLLQRLKVESKKSVTSVSRNDGIKYGLANIELNGQVFSMKTVAVIDDRYKVGWILDNQTTSCMRCSKGFSLLAWRHHCRSCGYVICQACGDKKINFEVFKEENPQGSRVCGFCHDETMNKTSKNGKNGKSGPRTLLAGTPVAVKEVVTKQEAEPAALPTLTENSFDMNATLDTEATTIESTTSEITTHSAYPAAAPLDAAEKFYVPKMRPSMAGPSRPACEHTEPTIVPAAMRRGSGTGLGLDLPAPATLAVHHVPQANPAVTVAQPVLLDLSSAQAAPSLGLPQHDQSAPAPPARKSAKEVPSAIPSSAQPTSQSSGGVLTGSLQPISRTYDYSAREDEQSLSAHSLAALNSSIVSTATKTTINTALNGKLTAPPPRLGVTCTAPVIFSPVSKITDAQGFDISTPPSGGSVGSGEVIVDMSKFGSPVTRKLIMEDARCNVIWEADDDDASSTTCSSIAPTPSSGISGTTNGGAGVGYIRSPWDNTFSPFNSAQKPRRLMGSGNTSAGKSGRRRKFSTDQPCVRFAAEDAALGSSAMADIANEVEASPGLPLTREQLLFQQQYLRHQQMHLQNQQAQAGKVPTKVDLQSRRDAENAHVNVMPATTAAGKEVSKEVKGVQKNDTAHGTLAVPSANIDTKASVAVGLPALGKSGVNKPTRAAAPR